MRRISPYYRAYRVAKFFYDYWYKTEPDGQTVGDVYIPPGWEQTCACAGRDVRPGVYAYSMNWNGCATWCAQFSYAQPRPPGDPGFTILSTQRWILNGYYRPHSNWKWTAPGPVVDPITDPALHPQGRTSFVPAPVVVRAPQFAYSPTRPRERRHVHERVPRRRERKWIADHGFARWVLKVFSATTEVVDVGDCAVSAMPPEYQRGNRAQTYARIAKSVEEGSFDIAKFARCLAVNHVEDKIIGALNRRAQDWVLDNRIGGGSSFTSVRMPMW